jgi:hypothetical protein
MIQEYYRQMRKFGCNILAVVQQYEEFAVVSSLGFGGREQEKHRRACSESSEPSLSSGNRSVKQILNLHRVRNGTF